MLVQVENLESRFAEFDDFLGELADKRDEVHEAFSARKQTLADARARRAERLADSAARVLQTVTRRAATLADADAVATYFASDPMPAKVRRIADELRDTRRPGQGGGARRPPQGRPPGGPARPARPHRPLRRRRPHPPPRHPPLRRQHPAPRPDPGPARRGPRLRADRHRLPLAGDGPRLRRHPPVLGPSAAVGVARGLPRRAPRRPAAGRARPDRALAEAATCPPSSGRPQRRRTTRATSAASTTTTRP